MHLRPSGLRAKRPTYVPALVAITQTSILGDRRRRLSPREAARLQGLPEWFDFGDQPDAATYKQMGNGVNVGAAYHVFREHVCANLGRRQQNGARSRGLQSKLCASAQTPPSSGYWDPSGPSSRALAASRPLPRARPLASLACVAEKWVSTDAGPPSGRPSQEGHRARDCATQGAPCGRRTLPAAPSARQGLHPGHRLPGPTSGRLRRRVLLARLPEHGRKTPWTGPNAGSGRRRCERNAERDRVDSLAEEHGWRVVRVWECEIREDA